MKASQYIVTVDTAVGSDSECLILLQDKPLSEKGHRIWRNAFLDACNQRDEATRRARELTVENNALRAALAEFIAANVPEKIALKPNPFRDFNHDPRRLGG